MYLLYEFFNCVLYLKKIFSISKLLVIFIQIYQKCEKKKSCFLKNYNKHLILTSIIEFVYNKKSIDVLFVTFKTHETPSQLFSEKTHFHKTNSSVALLKVNKFINNTSISTVRPVFFRFQFTKTYV